MSRPLRWLCHACRREGPDIERGRSLVPGCPHCGSAEGVWLLVSASSPVLPSEDGNPTQVGKGRLAARYKKKDRTT